MSNLNQETLNEAKNTAAERTRRLKELAAKGKNVYQAIADEGATKDG